MCALRLQDLPSVDSLLHTRSAAELIAAYGRPLVLTALRHTLDDLRANVERLPPALPRETILQYARRTLETWSSPTLRPVINASGVMIHTNLGRAPLSKSAIKAIHTIGGGYSNLEYDLSRGRRGSRLTHAEALICRLSGAQAALVVNNNAAAVLLTLAALARRRRVLIARTQLVEIGGGFRVPEVMRQSGCKLVEIGATNRVHLQDYAEAIQEQPIALVLIAHRSNFTLVGFTAEPPLEAIARLAHEAGLPLVYDLGSGALLDTAAYGLKHEPTVQEALQQGADLVCFSGDKLLGGPQAGIIAGRADLIGRLKKHPLARALRADKLALAALSATLIHYLKDEAPAEIPLWRMIATPAEMLTARVQAWIAALGRGEAIPGTSTIGGGSLPGAEMPTTLLALEVPHPNRFLKRLRQCNPPIIARIHDGRVVCDPRTVLPEQEGAFLVGMQNALRAGA